MDMSDLSRKRPHEGDDHQEPERKRPKVDEPIAIAVPPDAEVDEPIAIAVPPDAECIEDVKLGERATKVQRDTVLTFFKQQLDTGTNKFPGCQVVSLDNHNKFLLFTMEYMVTWKADGSRYLMAILGNFGTFIVSRKMEVIKVGITFPNMGGLLDHTLLDGEMTIDEEADPQDPSKKKRSLCYYVYDSLVIEGKSVMGKNLLERLAAAKQVVKARKTRGLPEDFDVEQKWFYPVVQAKMMTKGSSFLKRIKHETDGLIFTPIHMPYIIGTSNSLLKWKPADMNSVDFRLKVEEKDEEHDGAGMRTAALEVMDSGKPVRFATMKCTDEEAARWNEQIVECRYAVNNEDRDNEWRIMRGRADKDHPNARHTAEGVMTSISSNITEEGIVAFIESRERFIGHSSWERENVASFAKKLLQQLTMVVGTEKVLKGFAPKDKNEELHAAEDKKESEDKKGAEDTIEEMRFAPKDKNEELHAAEDKKEDEDKKGAEDTIEEMSTFELEGKLGMLIDVSSNYRGQGFTNETMLSAEDSQQVRFKSGVDVNTFKKIEDLLKEKFERSQKSSNPMTFERIEEVDEVLSNKLRVTRNKVQKVLRVIEKQNISHTNVTCPGAPVDYRLSCNVERPKKREDVAGKPVLRRKKCAEKGCTEPAMKKCESCERTFFCNKHGGKHAREQAEVKNPHHCGNALPIETFEVEIECIDYKWLKKLHDKNNMVPAAAFLMNELRKLSVRSSQFGPRGRA